MTLHEWRVWVRSKFYIPFTLATAVVTALALSLVQSIERRPTFITFTVAAVAWLALVLIDTLIMVLDEWQDWLATVNFWRRPVTVAGRPRVRLSRTVAAFALIDMYLAVCGAHALVAMAPWLFDDSADKALYYTGFELSSSGTIRERDPWTVYFYFLSLSFWVYNGVGFSRFTPVTSWVAMLYGALSVVGYLYGAVTLGVLLVGILSYSNGTGNTNHTDNDEYSSATTTTTTTGVAAAYHQDIEQGGYYSSGIDASLVIGGNNISPTYSLPMPYQQQQQHHHYANTDRAPMRQHYPSSGPFDYSSRTR